MMSFQLSDQQREALALLRTEVFGVLKQSVNLEAKLLSQRVHMTRDEWIVVLYIWYADIRDEAINEILASDEPPHVMIGKYIPSLKID